MPHILLVDDDPDLLEMVSLALKANEIEVDCIQTGNLLFTTIAEIDPDLILMDIYLGDADGRDLCRLLKADLQFQKIPVILYSAGNITKISVEQSLADDFLNKPFEITQLIHRIKQNIGSML